MNDYAFGTVFLLDAVIKLSLLLSIVWVGSLVMRKRSAAAQHRWWTLGFVGCLILPAICFFTPTWTLPILPSTSAGLRPSQLDGVSMPEIRVPVNLTHSDRSVEPTRQRERISKPRTASDLGSTNPVGEKSIESTRVQEENLTTLSIPSVLLILWIVGIALCWLRITWQHILLKRVLRDCVRLDNPEWNVLLRKCSESLSLHHKASLFQHNSTQSPVSTGVWNPAVILPHDADTWDADRRRLVLLHELAHVQRRDVLTQTVAGLVCGLYWFNPLCWYGLLQMRKLRELACDDLVLSCDQQPSSYADVLLGVARSYRHQHYSTAVGMAHSANVESRIMAILDKTRRRVSFSRTAARLLLVAAATLVGVVGTAQLRSQAEPATEPEKAEAETTVEAGETSKTPVAPAKVWNDGYVMTKGSMQFRVLDPDGKAFPGVKVTVKRKDYATDTNGIAVINFPERLSLLRVWVRKQGYVPLFVQWWPKEQADGHIIPEEYTVRLQKGTVVGGVVQDEQGKPVQGVSVEVKRNPSDVDGRNVRPQFGTWLAYGGAAVKTDAQGRWSLDNVPAGDDIDISVRLSHPDFSDDSGWGGLQRKHGITTQKLRGGDARIVMSRGVNLKGEVVDLDGKPVTRGWVVWSDTPYFGQGVWEKEIGDQGLFETPQLKPGEYPISIIAPGFAAQRRVVDIKPGMESMRFELKPGKRIEIHFVDKDGNPIPKVGVYLANTSIPNTWQGSNALHNHKHPNVPDYGISRKADESGVFVWDWAPAEPVRFSVGAMGYAQQQVSLVAKDEPHIITLAGARVVAGLVTDAQTGEPIPDFRAMPVIIFRPDFFSTRFSDMKRGENGRYELPLTGSADPNDQYRVRFEADGYRSIVTDESFGPLDGRVELNMQLEPASVREGRFVDPQGEPVFGAKVIEGTSTWVPMTRNGEPDSYGERTVLTDKEGRFELNSTTEPTRVRVLHDSGIAEKLVDPEDDAIGDMELKPWASITGRLIQEGKPIGDQSVYFSPLVRRGLGQARFEDSYYARTDPQGRFEMKRLPPGAGSLWVPLGPWQESPLTSAERLALELAPGEERSVVLGGAGAVLTGQVVATGRDEVPLDRNWSLNYLISRDRGVAVPYDDGFPKLNFDPSGPVKTAWSLDPHFNDWVSTRENHFVKLTANGKLRVTGVEPGEYDLVIRLYEQPAGCLVETVGEKVIPVRVEGEGEIDLGQIEVPCRAGPRVGSDMRAFEFVDTSGRKQFVNDLTGQYVVMHVWASWCRPCLESMPDIQAAAERVADLPAMFIGLNVDQDSAEAEELAEQNGWSWSQNYLGDDSATARQLAISSVPTYYLVGPDGMLIASATEWHEIKDELFTLLDENRE